MPSDLTEDKKEEYNRWQGYANALLLASTVLFSATAIVFSNDKAALFTLSAFFGLATIVSTVSWFALESKAKRARPPELYCASIALGCQVGFLLLALGLKFI